MIQTVITVKGWPGAIALTVLTVPAGQVALTAAGPHCPVSRVAAGAQRA